MAENVINLWERSLLEDTSHLPTLKWSTAIRKVTREEIIAMRPRSISWPVDLEEDKQETLEELLDGNWMETDDKDDDDVVVEYEGDFHDSDERVTSGDFSASENVTSGDMNVNFGNNNNNVYVPPFTVSDKPTTTMASQQAQLAASLANQPVPTPGKTPASTPSQGAVSRKTPGITTTSTTAAKTTPPKTKKKKTKTGPAQDEVVTITKKHLTELLKLP